MARPSNEFDLAWSSLSCDDATPGWQAISLPSAGTVEIQAGRRSPGNTEAILFDFPTARLSRGERLPEGKGFMVERIVSSGTGGLQLALTRQEEGSKALFSAMACDVVGAIDETAKEGGGESKLLRVFIGRVLAWQQFMSRGSAPLGHEAELGLVGELYFISMLLDWPLPPQGVLRAWVGPFDAPQDFLLGDGAIEVKTTLSSSGLPVKIGSLEQLDDADVSPLFLAAFRFSTGEKGPTLPEMVTEIARRVEGEPGAGNFLCERLMAAGYVETQAGQYSRRFEPKEMRIFRVAEGFPRLTTGVVVPGITRAHYEINLNHAERFVVDFDTALEELGVR